ncbi:unnamed protein product [Clonostachys rosea]|uniref:BD-FAE-like domain-containing protein n=1 Tax=Bionectria ochroleuca TaxID=29856 RepID=A0ABY6V4F4_BIOOC|nr:unnamed protein product [Clonostachys rosea]
MNPDGSTSIAETVGPTFKLYRKLLQRNEDAIKSTLRKTFAFGPNPRHLLDLYYPSANQTGADCPVLIFIYGGGLWQGDRLSPDGLLYANLGHFFAEKCGYVVAIPDYRLVPEAKFPSGGEDIALVVQWLMDNPDKFGAGDGEKARSLFMMGSSAGSIHLSTFLLQQCFASIMNQIVGSGNSCRLRLRAVILCSMPAHFRHSNPARAQVLTSYFADDIDRNCPLGQLEICKRENHISEVMPGIKVLLLTGSLDPEDEILGPVRDFATCWRSDGARSAAMLEVQVMDGHNHISPNLSLGTCDLAEETWGFQVAEFCNAIA